MTRRMGEIGAVNEFVDRTRCPIVFGAVQSTVPVALMSVNHRMMVARDTRRSAEQRARRARVGWDAVTGERGQRAGSLPAAARGAGDVIAVITKTIDNAPTAALES